MADIISPQQLVHRDTHSKFQEYLKLQNHCQHEAFIGFDAHSAQRVVHAHLVYDTILRTQECLKGVHNKSQRKFDRLNVVMVLMSGASESG